MQQQRAVSSERFARASERTVRTGIGDATVEAEIRELMDDWIAAVRAQDVDRIVSHYARDIIAFDAVSQLQFKGVDAYKEHWKSVSPCARAR